MLAELRTPDGEPLDLTLTTNGSLLARKAAALKDAGLKRITVSLDALDDAIFRRMNDVDFPVADVLARHRRGAARRLRPDQGQHGRQARHQRRPDRADGAPLPRHAASSLRFIEYMDVGATNGWRMDEVLPSARGAARLARVRPLEPLAPAPRARPPSAGATRDGAPARSA